jgi:hypothetical protein
MGQPNHAPGTLHCDIKLVVTCHHPLPLITTRTEPDHCSSAAAVAEQLLNTATPNIPPVIRAAH